MMHSFHSAPQWGVEETSLFARGPLPSTRNKQKKVGSILKVVSFVAIIITISYLILPIPTQKNGGMDDPLLLAVQVAPTFGSFYKFSLFI